MHRIKILLVGTVLTYGGMFCNRLVIELNNGMPIPFTNEGYVPYFSTSINNVYTFISSETKLWFLGDVFNLTPFIYYSVGDILIYTGQVITIIGLCLYFIFNRRNCYERKQSAR